MSAYRRLIEMILVLAFIGGCGGGGGGNGGNATPVANAGIAQIVSAGSLVRLNGGASSDADNDPLTYQWTLTTSPPGSQAVLAGASSVAPSFTADLPGIYIASLVVSDGKAGSAVSTVMVTAAVNQVLAGILAFAGSNDLASFSVFTIRPDGSNQRQLTPFVAGTQDLYPTFSPDASRIVFQRDAGLLNPSVFVMNADGSELERVFDATFSDDEIVITPSWTPDDALIVFAKGRPVASNIVNLLFDICFFEIDAATPPRCIPAAAQEINTSPNVSPDRQKVAYSCLWSDGRPLNVSGYYVRICLMNVDGSAIVQLTSGDFHVMDSAPNWSPDGAKIAFTRQTLNEPTGSYDRNSAVYVMNADGSALTRLTPPGTGSCESSAWSPDGAKLAFVCSAAPGNIVIINIDGSSNADGSKLVTIPTGLAYAGAVSWSRR